MENQPYIREQFRLLERNVLLLIVLQLPFFAFAYLNTTRPTRTYQIPELPEFLDTFTLSFVLALLLLQQFNFNRIIRTVRREDMELADKFMAYKDATLRRYWILFIAGLLCAAGLWFYQNVGFTVAYAIILILVSVLKPSPARIIRLFQLEGKEKDLIFNVNRSE